MAAIKLVNELTNTAVAFFHEPVASAEEEGLVSLYRGCVLFGCDQKDIERGTNCPACGTLRPKK